MKRRLFQAFTVVLLLISVWTAYANVFSDDTEVRAKARVAVNHAAGCADNESCPMEGLRGDRGMISETIEYDLVRRGHYVVNCRRAFVVAGDYTCEVIEGKRHDAAPSVSASAK